MTYDVFGGTLNFTQSMLGNGGCPEWQTQIHKGSPIRES